MAEGGSLTVQTILTGAAEGIVDLSVADLPENATFDARAGSFVFTPNYTQAGEYDVTVQATQGTEVVGTETVHITVENLATFELQPSGNQTVSENGERTVLVSRTAGVSNDVSFNVTALPRNASYDDAIGTLSFAPDFTQQGTHRVTFEASQDGQVVDSEPVTFTVTNVDVLSITPARLHMIDEGSSLSVRANISSVAQAKVVLSAVDLPANASFNGTTGAFTFAPDFSQSGVHSPTIRATQNGRTVEDEVVRITVINVNVPPTVTVESPTGNVAGDITATYTIEDFDGDPVSLEVEYREDASGPWTTAALEQAIADTNSYAGTLTWRSREDVPSTGGADVQLRVIPSDSETGTPVMTPAFTLVNLLGDYDEDTDVDFDDLAFFTQAWREEDATRDIGPTTGTAPDLVPAFDATVDFEDLMTFVVMWNWSSENAPLAAPAVVLDSGAQPALTQETTVDRSDWRRQRVGFRLAAPLELLAARITVQYDPQALRVSVGESTDATRGRVFLARHDEETGVLDIQAARLTAGALADTLTSIQVESLRQTDADLRVTFDVRDRFNRSQRGQDIFQLRFEPPPADTTLLQNYPNPFNPETWIPFELSEDADVVVTIYDLEGSLIWTLRLGERTAGRYRSRDRAAYWNGANGQGESVASGVYIYELRAGDYRQAHRMVIRK